MPHHGVGLAQLLGTSRQLSAVDAQRFGELRLPLRFVRDELVQRWIHQPDSHGEPRHRAQRLADVVLHVRVKLIERRFAFLARAGHYHLA